MREAFCKVVVFNFEFCIFTLDILVSKAVNFRHGRIAMNVLTIDAAIGKRIRELRKEAGVKQEFLALCARRWGVEWSRPQVAWIETGRRKIQLAEFLILPAILSEALGRSAQSSTQIRYEDLMPMGNDPVALTKELSVEPGGLHRLVQLEGRTKKEDLKGNIEDLDMLFKSPATERLEFLDELSAKAASALDITTIQVVELAKRLWNRPFSAERDRRFTDRHAGKQLDASEVQGLRSHVTRELMAELRAQLSPKKRKPAARKAKKGGKRREQ